MIEANATSRKVAGSTPHDSEICSASSKNEYKKIIRKMILCGKTRPASNLTANYKSIIYTMWASRYLTTQKASKACNRDNFISFPFSTMYSLAVLCPSLFV
jgi:hypothetical protein